jgi:predicted RNA binding protein YcfA (HicA-like mRNA interferase family)
MSPKLPVISGRDLTKFFSKNGFQLVRQKGSHMVMRRIIEPHTILVIPDHSELDRGTLRSIIKDSGYKIEEFLEKFK